MTATPSLQKEFDFLELAQNLKMEMRHCWYKDGRRESVAEHSWRLALMVMRYHDRLDEKIDVSKALKIATVHDLAEAIAGDIPVTEQTDDVKAQKTINELAAMDKIKDLLGDSNGQELYAQWMDYENQTSKEAKFVKALDKLEAWIQHLEAPTDTWEEKEKLMIFDEKWLHKYCWYDSFLTTFADEVIERATQKLEEAGEDVDALRAQVTKLAA